MSNEYLNNKLFEELIIRFQSSSKEVARNQLFIGDLTLVCARRKTDIVASERLRTKLEYYKQINAAYEAMREQLALVFYTLSENIVKFAKFNLLDPEDAVQEGAVICFQKIEHFDKDKGKAFNYMTTCILNHFRQLYRTARNYNDFKRKYHDILFFQVEKVLQRGRVSYYNSVEKDK